MNNLKIFVSLILMLLFLASCKKGDNNKNINISQDGLIDEIERTLIDECTEHLFTSKSEVESNLIGEWQLIGHGNSMFENDPQPSIHLTFSNDDLIIEFEDGNVNWTDTVSWEIEEVNVNTTPTPVQYLRLITTPEHPELMVSNFCERYMFIEVSPARADPAMMYLYEKVD